MRSVPISAARRVAEEYGYDQVVIVARKVGEDGGEHVTTYGVDRANCAVAARIGNFLKAKIMGWSDVRSAMVDRFLSWPLPRSVRSDACVTQEGYCPRVGTNLLTADEAGQMIDHILGS